MTDKPLRVPAKGILQLAAPLVISFWLRSAFNLVDSVYAAELPGIGDESLAAIGLAAPFQFILIACWVGSSNGLTARLSAAMGAQEGAKIEQLKRAAMRMIFSLIGVFLALAAIAYLAADWYAPDAVTASQFRIYAPIVLAGSGITAFWSILPDSIVKAHHDTRSTMWAGLIAAFTNLGLNTLFVFVFHWGILGIALATVLARLASLAYALARAREHENARIDRKEDCEPSVFAKPVFSILVIAVPSAITFLLMAFESLVVNKVLASGPDATATVAAWGFFDRCGQFMAMPVIATSAAMLPFAARLYGQGDWQGIRKGVRTSMLAGVAYAVFFVAPLALLVAPWVADKLSDAEPTRRALSTALMFLPLVVLFLLPNLLQRSAFEGMQHPRPGLITAFIRSILLVIPLTWLGVQLAPEWGWAPIAGVCAGYSLAILLASGIITWWFQKYFNECAGAQSVRTNT